MRLQLDILTIRDVQFAAETTVRDGVLHVEKKALQALLLRGSEICDGRHRDRPSRRRSAGSRGSWM